MIAIVACCTSLITGARRLPTWILWLGVVLLLAASVPSLRWWNIFHYQLGTRYIKEVGYTHLYECYLEATQQDQPRRDLTTYTFIPADVPPDCPQQEFSPERWLAFSEDMQAAPLAGNTILDKGLNATPTWIAQHARLSDAPPQTAVLSDPIALGLAFTLVIAGLGWRKAGYAALITLTHYATFDRLWGNIAQYQWLAFSLVGVAAMQSDWRTFDRTPRLWSILGGVALGYATALAIFPAFLLIGKNRFAWLGSAVGLAVGLTVGLFNPVGPSLYLDFLSNMATHSSFIAAEPYNISLRNLLTVLLNWDASQRYLLGFLGELPPVPLESGTPWFLWLLLLPAVIASPYGILFGLTTLSRYYYVVLSVVPLERHEHAARTLLALNAAILFWAMLRPESAFALGQVFYLVYFAAYWVYWKRPDDWYQVLVRSYCRVRDHRTQTLSR